MDHFHNKELHFFGQSAFCVRISFLRLARRTALPSRQASPSMNGSQTRRRSGGARCGRGDARATAPRLPNRFGRVGAKRCAFWHSAGAMRENACQPVAHELTYTDRIDRLIEFGAGRALACQRWLGGFGLVLVCARRCNCIRGGVGARGRVCA